MQEATVLTYAPPAGPYRVGVRDGEFTDTTYTALRPEDAGGRRIMVRVWYPAAAGEAGAETRRYFSDAEVEVAGLGVTGDTPGMLPKEWIGRLGEVQTYSVAGAPAAEGTFPALAFSHGALSYVNQNTPLMEHLAGLGYIVWSVSHPGESGGIVYPNGDTLPFDASFKAQMFAMAANPSALDRLSPDIAKRLAAARDSLDDKSLGPWSRRWVDDTRALIDALELGSLSGPAGAIIASCDLERIGVLGMSFGAAAAASTAQADTRVKAVVSLDGGQFLSDLLDTDIRLPFLELTSDAAAPIRRMGMEAHFVEYNEFFFERLRTAGTREDVLRLLIPDAIHLELTDFLFFSADERAAALPGGGAADGPRTIAAINSFIGGYFNSVLKGEANGYPQSQLAEFPELQRIDMTPIREWAAAQDQV